MIKIDHTQPNAEKLVGRLANWKFKSALQHLEGQSDEVVETVKTLSTMFSNSGWFEGNMGHLVSVVVQTLVESHE